VRRIRLLTVATAICLLGPTALSVSAAAATRSITVTPNTNLKSGQLVTVDGSGFPASVSIELAQCPTNTVPVNCTSGFAATTTASDGTFSRDVAVSVQGCQTQTCYIGAAVASDIDNTAVFAPIAFNPGVADGRIKRRSDGQIFGDNVYFPPQARSHPIAPGGYWTYALQAQNDGPDTDDITVGATVSQEGTQFFYGFYDVTSQVRSQAGLVFHAMAPGEVRTFAIRFHAHDNPVGTRLRAFVNFHSVGSGAGDTLDLRVKVQSPST
jgi:Neocarzinostatin family